MMKIVGFILMFVSIIGGIIALIIGVTQKETAVIIESVVAIIFGSCTSLAVVYAADVPQTFDAAFAAKRSSDSNSKSIIRMIEEINALKNQIKELKEIIKNNQK